MKNNTCKIILSVPYRLLASGLMPTYQGSTPNSLQRSYRSFVDYQLQRRMSREGWQMTISFEKAQLHFNTDIWITSGIFSSHYLLERLPQAGAKIWPEDEELLQTYKAIHELYRKNIVGLRKGNEANTERRFIDKVFNKLGFGYLNQDKIPEAERRQVQTIFSIPLPKKLTKPLNCLHIKSTGWQFQLQNQNDGIII